MKRSANISMSNASNRQPGTEITVEPALPQPETIRSRELFAGRNEVHIRHDTELYRLRVTKNGKLILTK